MQKNPLVLTVCEGYAGSLVVMDEVTTEDNFGKTQAIGVTAS